MADWNKIPSEIVQVIVAGDGDPATVAWAHRGEGRLADLAEPQLGIAAAVALGNVAALSSVNAPKDLKKAAAAALHRLRASGVKVEAPKPAAFQLQRDHSTPPSRAFIATPGPEGEVELLLTASDENESCALGLILGAGVEEVRHAHLSRGDLRNTWRQAESNGLLELPFASGLHYADRYLAGHRSGDFAHFLSHVPAGALAAARALDPLAAPIQAVEENAENAGQQWVLPRKLWDASLLNRAVADMFRLMDGGEQLYDKVVVSVCETLDKGDRSAWLAWFDLMATTFRLYGRNVSADKALEYKQAIQDGAPSSSIPAVVNSVKLGLMHEALSQIQGQRQEDGMFDGMDEEDDHAGHDHSHGGHDHAAHDHAGHDHSGHDHAHEGHDL